MQSPPSRYWTESDGQLLRSLREAAGLEATAFARFCALSNAQLAELEHGGHGRFYNDRIKANTGRKLLMRLGHVPAEPLAPADAQQPDEPVVAPRPVVPAYRKIDTRSGGSPWLLRLVVAVAVVATLVVILKPRAARETPQVAGVPSAYASTPNAQEPGASTVPAELATPSPAKPPAAAAPKTR